MMPSCFIIMPITTSPKDAQLYNDDQHFAHTLTHLMIPAVKRANYQALPPIAAGADLIHAEIVRKLETADLVLCDISSLNPNVFFELGIRTAVDRPVCIVRDTFTKQIPFDTGIMNVHQYDPSLSPWTLDGEVDAIAQHLQAAAKRSEGRNPLWRYFGLTTRAAFKEGESSLEEKIDLLMLQLDNAQRVSQASNLVERSTIFDSRRETAFLEELDHVLGRSRNKVRSIAFGPGSVQIDIGTIDLTVEQYSRLKHLAGLSGLQLHLKPDPLEQRTHTE
jgi:hypothetical protein